MRGTPQRLLLVGCFCLAGCATLTELLTGKKATPGKVAAAGPQGPKPISIKSFSDTMAATSVIGQGNALWVGTARGLIRWDLAKSTSQLITATEGLPGNRVAALAFDRDNAVWVATAGGISHQVKGAWKNLPAAPVGDPVSAMAITGDGTVWVGGPNGLAKLSKKGTWERQLGTTPVTALVAAKNDLWVGTIKRGILHVIPDKKEDRVEAYGPEQGAETESITSITATENGVMAIGDGKNGQRIAFYDGFRFYSYAIKGSQSEKLEWVRRIGNDALVGSGTSVYALLRTQDKPTQGGVWMEPTTRSTKPPLAGLAKNDPPSVVVIPSDAPVAPPPPAPTPAFAPPPPKPAPGAAPAKAAPPPPAPVVAAKPDPSSNEPAPAFQVNPWGPRLPEGVSAVGPDGIALFIGTRYLGAAKVDDKEVTPYRMNDLVEGAERLSVACDRPDDCWVATGQAKAWRYDGTGFEVAEIDGEAGSKVLALIEPPNGGPMALHRGKDDNTLRVSTESGDRWIPTIFRDLAVPAGVPDITFARFDTKNNLWIGLRYVDKDGDAVDYGAAEVDLNRSTTTYHRQVGVMAQKDPSIGSSLPNDIESAWFRPTESWFGTRSGAARVKGPDVRLFTENDGLESEIIHDIVEGPDGKIWVATAHGIGEYDGSKWEFPKAGDPLKVKATSLARDKFGSVYVGSGSGLFLCGPRDPNSNGEEKFTLQKIGKDKGLLDEHVLDLAMDKFGRVWVLSEKGMSIVER